MQGNHADERVGEFLQPEEEKFFQTLVQVASASPFSRTYQWRSISDGLFISKTQGVYLSDSQTLSLIPLLPSSPPPLQAVTVWHDTTIISEALVICVSAILLRPYKQLCQA